MKKYRVNVNGTVYEVELEDISGSAVAAAPVAAPAAAPAAPVAAAPVGGEQVDVVFRTFSTHRARRGVDVRVCGHGECGFGLSEALHQLYSCEFIPLFEHARVERFAGNGAIFER